MKLSVRDIKELAKPLDPCNKLGNVKRWAELVNLLFTPQGREFCEKYKFPALEHFRTIGVDLTKYNVFIDKEINLDNCEKVLLVGNTQASINISNPNHLTKIVVMHGAKATINASGYAVVHCVNIGGEIVTNKDNTVKILE